MVAPISPVNLYSLEHLIHGASCRFAHSRDHATVHFSLVFAIFILLIFYLLAFKFQFPAMFRANYKKRKTTFCQGQITNMNGKEEGGCRDVYLPVAWIKGQCSLDIYLSFL
ncbi:hypothetical protein SLEP1_g37980 [Rubroshorea leprosula]|uniref:Uncharacterized protein n=1 Tax=Rubroshorea leprosula TaxID=152421 RepID=A0AAV5KWP7_9ROSI|nr:hypothetical protein SLEP1_g37980 [Rubroshorea leprosula]